MPFHSCQHWKQHNEVQRMWPIPTKDKVPDQSYIKCLVGNWKSTIHSQSHQMINTSGTTAQAATMLKYIKKTRVEMESCSGPLSVTPCYRESESQNWTSETAALLMQSKLTTSEPETPL